MGSAGRRPRGAALAAALALTLAQTLSGCSTDSQPAAPSRPAPTLRFECAEGCGSYKTVRAGETPPPCCGVPMERPAAAAPGR